MTLRYINLLLTLTLTLASSVARGSTCPLQISHAHQFGSFQFSSLLYYICIKMSVISARFREYARRGPPG